MRTFVGSRGASVDVSFSDETQDCGYASLPSTGMYAQGMHVKAVGDSPQAWNKSALAEGLLGGFLPSAIFYIPVYRPDVSACTLPMQQQFCNHSVQVSRNPLGAMCAVECNKTKPHTPTPALCWGAFKTTRGLVC